MFHVTYESPKGWILDVMNEEGNPVRRYTYFQDAFEAATFWAMNRNKIVHELGGK